MEDKLFIIEKFTKEVSLLNVNGIERYSEPQKGFYGINYKVAATGQIIPYIYSIGGEVQIPTGAETSYKHYIKKEDLIDFMSEKTKSICKSMNIKNKLGYLFFGEQGCGKTTLIYSIASFFNDNYNAMSFIVKSYKDLAFVINFIREINLFNKDITFVIVMDEFDDIVEEYEGYVKQILDGSDSPNNTIFLAATNYIKDIPDSIKDRPSRFKYVFDISKVTQADIAFGIVNNFNNSLEDKYKHSEQEIKNMVPTCLDKTMDQIKHLFIDKTMKRQIVELVKT